MNVWGSVERGVTVIVCTHNGATNLVQTLRHLAGQQMPNDLPWQLIVVDNASTDETTLVVQREWNKLGNPVTLVCLREERPGKYFALQTAISVAKYAYFVICDDDNWLAPNYLEKVAGLLDSYPQVGAVGGRGIPVTEDNQSLPNWFDKYQEGYAVGPQGKKSGDVTHKGHLWGAGLGSRTELYRALYLRYPSFLLMLNDPDMMSTEDSEYCLRLVLRGFRLYYDETMVYQHFIPAKKLTESFIKRLYNRHYKSYTVNGVYFLVLKAFKSGRISKIRLWSIRFSGHFRGLFAFSYKSKVKARTKGRFLRARGENMDRVGQGVVSLMVDDRLPTPPMRPSNVS